MPYLKQRKVRFSSGMHINLRNQFPLSCPEFFFEKTPIRLRKQIKLITSKEEEEPISTSQNLKWTFSFWCLYLRESLF